MGINTNSSRILIKRSDVTTVVPTIPSVEPQTNEDLNNLDPTDVLIGEYFVNTADDRLWIRTDSGLIELTNQPGGVSSLGDLSDVTIGVIAGDGILFYDSDAGEWFNKDIQWNNRQLVAQTTTSTTISNDEQTMIVNGSSLTITMPPISTENINIPYTIKNGNVTNTEIVTTGSDTIDGKVNLLLNTEWESATIINDGSNWYIVNRV